MLTIEMAKTIALLCHIYGGADDIRRIDDVEQRQMKCHAYYADCILKEGVTAECIKGRIKAK